MGSIVVPLSKAFIPEQEPGRSVIEKHTNAKGEVVSIVQYDFMAALPKQEGMWVENCINCHVPMRQVQVDVNVSLIGVPESARYHPDKFNEWALHPVVQNNNLWGCYKCNSIWTIALGSFWVKVSLNGLKEIRMNEVKPLVPELEEVAKVPFDPGIPIDGARKCPECHAWCKIEDYSATENIHVCPNCKTGQIAPKDKDTEAIQGE